LLRFGLGNRIGCSVSILRKLPKGRNRLYVSALGVRHEPARNIGGRRAVRVIASEFVSADGYIVGPGEDMSWVMKNFN